MFEYTYDSASIDARSLPKDVEAALPGKDFNSFHEAGDLYRFYFTLELSTPNLQILTDTVATHQAASVARVLAAAKAHKNEAIDFKTQNLIAGGFVHDSKTFSLSTPARDNWLGLKAYQDSITWPRNITTIDDQEYELTEADLTNFGLAALGTIGAHYDSGRALKLTVNAAADLAAVAAITDAR